VPLAETEIDWLENAALEHGWEGNAWQKTISLPDKEPVANHAEALRQKLIPPFLSLTAQTTTPLSGAQLATALREFWDTLAVEKTLAAWSAAVPQSSIGNPQSAIHTTVLSQLLKWLDNLTRAFPTEALPLRDWLPILEAGLANLTIGVIPPTLDQVLVGAIDRSRNPDLKLAFVLGLNEGVFPAPPKEDPLLNELERDTLQLHGASLGASLRHRLGHEWFYGYIACTRSSKRLILTCAQADARGNKLNQSPFFDHLKKIFPALEIESWQPPAPFTEVEHINEIVAPAIRLEVGRVTPCAPQRTETAIATSKCSSSVSSPSLAPSDGERAGVRGLFDLPQLTPILTKAQQLTSAAHDQLSSAVAEQLHGRELATSVSALENFAACPFKFFISHGLRAAERKEYELDSRERGSFQHEVLTHFHTELVAENLRWRDLTPDQAATRSVCCPITATACSSAMRPAISPGNTCWIRSTRSSACSSVGRAIINSIPRLSKPVLALAAIPPGPHGAWTSNTVTPCSCAVA